MKKTLLTIALGSSQAFGGSGMSGGTPPALQDLEQVLVLNPELDGGLFDYKGDIGLLTKIKLQPQMLVSGASNASTRAIEIDGGIGGSNPPVFADIGGTGSGGTPPLLKFSAEDIARLRDRSNPIHAVGAEGQNLSFEVLPGDTLTSVSLKDRRMTMRESVK
jgi:hypothetical protein